MPPRHVSRELAAPGPAGICSRSEVRFLSLSLSAWGCGVCTDSTRAAPHGHWTWRSCIPSAWLARCIKDVASCCPLYPYTGSQSDRMRGQWGGLLCRRKLAGIAPSASTRPIDWYAHVQPAPFVPYLAPAQGAFTLVILRFNWSWCRPRIKAWTIYRARGSWEM